MRIETNLRLAKRNRRIAHFLFFFSMAVLIGGFIIANTQLASANKDNNLSAVMLFLPWLVLPIGFICTIISIRMTNLWIRQPRPEEAIRDGLKSISRKSVLYNYYHFPARHVLIAPQGAFAMVTRFQEGKFRVEGDKWTTPSGMFGVFMRLFRRDGIGNPTEDALKAAAYVQTLLDKKTPGIEVQPLIIFVDPRANVEIVNPTVPVLYANENQKPNLRDYLRDLAQKQQIEKPAAPQQGKKKGGDKNKTAEKVGGLDTESIADAFEDTTLEAR
ncbi:MAG: hypothetical protein ABI690_27270 [Chloroflexota bacterium]